MNLKEKTSFAMVGRQKEQDTLQAILQSGKSELLAVYGRRRVGKTFLLTSFFNQQDCIFSIALVFKMELQKINFLPLLIKLVKRFIIVQRLRHKKNGWMLLIR